MWRTAHDVLHRRSRISARRLHPPFRIIVPMPSCTAAVIWRANMVLVSIAMLAKARCRPLWPFGAMARRWCSIWMILTLSARISRRRIRFGLMIMILRSCATRAGRLRIIPTAICPLGIACSAFVKRTTGVLMVLSALMVHIVLTIRICMRQCATPPRYQRRSPPTRAVGRGLRKFRTPPGAVPAAL